MPIIAKKAHHRIVLYHKSVEFKSRRTDIKPDSSFQKSSKTNRTLSLALTTDPARQTQRISHANLNGANERCPNNEVMYEAAR